MDNITDEQIFALNAQERFFSESPTKYPEVGHGTQYHAGAPGVLGFARAVLALQPSASAEPTDNDERLNKEDADFDAWWASLTPEFRAGMGKLGPKVIAFGGWMGRAEKVPAVKQETPAHVCKFEPAIDLETREGWMECRCGKKQLYGKPYERPAKQGVKP